MSETILPLPPVTLRGWGVSLEPLRHDHADALMQAVQDGEIYKLNFTNAPDPTDDAAQRYIDKALAGQANGTMLPFVVRTADGDIVGATRYYEIEPNVPTLCIGHTWYAARVQRTHVNTSCKRLLLEHAFDSLGMAAVYFHTSHLNARSQAAIERLGATRDGIIRNHKRHRDGGLRDTYLYSVIASEWPRVRDGLDAKLANVAR